MESPSHTKRRKLLIAPAAAVAAVASTAPMIGRAQSAKTFNWTMTTAWPRGLPAYDDGPGSARAFAAKVKLMSGGRLTIDVKAAGELVKALEGFEACRTGKVEMNHGASYYWAKESFARQYFTTVPFGMSAQGHHAWLQESGLKLWNEAYAPLGLIALPANCSGVQMTGWFNREIRVLSDLKGLRMRIPGLAAEIYKQAGVDTVLLPGGEILQAFQGGKIDAAEWVGPFSDMKLNLHTVVKLYYHSGWHEPAFTGEIVINKKAWDTLPTDLQEIVRVASWQCVSESLLWLEARNAEAAEELIANHRVKFRALPYDVTRRLKEITADLLSSNAAKDPFTKKVHDSYMNFKLKHGLWGNLSETHFQLALK
jgi:TRAP-type mannitol/chloroaromatic compound transport system substrate-binding protein